MFRAGKSSWEIYSQTEPALLRIVTRPSRGHHLHNGSVRLVFRSMKVTRLLTLLATMSLFSAFASAEPLKVGDDAPIVSALTDAGTTLNLGDVYKGNAYTVVWFYPKALTGGCTKQGCSLRDASAELTKHGAAVVGVSTDPVEKQKEFKEVNHFPFPLLADTDKKVVKAFGQSATLFASRECYVIKGGKIVYKDTGVTDKQADNVLAFLASDKKS